MKRILGLLFFGLLILTAFGCQEAVQTLVIDSDSVMIEMDEVGTVPVRLRDDRQASKITYQSTDESVLYVTEQGDIIPISPGNATITVGLEGTDQTVNISVLVLEAGPEFTIPYTELSMYTEGSRKIELFANNKPYTGDDVHWISSDLSVAAVDSYGNVTALTPGTVLIHAKIGTADVPVKITVTLKPEARDTKSITIVGNSTIEVNASDALRVIADNDAECEIEWLSNNPDAVTVSTGGIVTGISEGTAVITAAIKDRPEISTELTITVVPETLHLTSYPSDRMYPVSYGYYLIVKDSRGQVVSKAECDFFNTDPAVLEVNESGSIKPHKEGEVTVTVSRNGISGSITLTVDAIPTENLRNAIVAIAISQMGYVEGHGNDTIYGAWYLLNGQPWCAMFVSWSAYIAGISTRVIPKYASVAYGLSWFQEKGPDFYKSYEESQTGVYTPICGDIVFFKSNGASHTAIVVKTVGDIMYTIEGNTSDAVKLRYYYYKNYNKITGYGIPAYGESSTPIMDFDVSAATFGGGISTE